jgi:hypothetical protein
MKNMIKVLSLTDLLQLGRYLRACSNGMVLKKLLKAYKLIY